MPKQHTPGPWHLTEYIKKVNPRGDTHRFATIRSGNDYWVADALPLDCEHGEADARLIAASPEMLGSMRATVTFLEILTIELESAAFVFGSDILKTRSTDCRHSAECMRETIAKAEGK